MYLKIGALENFAMFTGKRLIGVAFLNKYAGLKTCNFIKKKLKHVFPCKIREIFKNTFFYRMHSVAASGNISWTFSLLHLRTMNGVISWYVLVLKRLFDFMTCVSFLSNFFIFSLSFLWILLLFGFEVSLSILKIKHSSCS